MSVRKRGEAPSKANGAIKSGSAVQDETTDLSRWRLKDDRGCQTWHYLQTDDELKKWPITTADKYFLGLDTVSFQIRSIVVDGVKLNGMRRVFQNWPNQRPLCRRVKMA